MSGLHLPRRLVQFACAALVGALLGVVLAACGGGGSGGTGSQAHTTYAFGRIAGFGSVIVNGVHYDESSALIQDDDGVAQARGDLGLGMMVEIDGDDSGIAHAITFHTLMRGPVESVGSDSLVVLGQTVAVTPTTMFGDSLAGGLAAIKAGMVVRMFGTLTTSGGYTATRIDTSNTDSYALRGFITAMDATAKTLNIGNALIDVSGVSLPSDLAVGSLVRVKLQTTQVNGAWVATAIRPGMRRPHEGDRAEVEGTITDFTSPTSFSVDGLPVDASGAQFPEGTAGLMQGARVEVEGAIVNGVLVATKVEVESEHEDEMRGFEVRGTIASVNTANSTFVVHGVTVSFAGSVSFEDGTAADLVVGARVEVKGAPAADGTTLNATRISFEH